MRAHGRCWLGAAAAFPARVFEAPFSFPAGHCLACICAGPLFPWASKTENLLGCTSTWPKGLGGLAPCCTVIKPWFLLLDPTSSAGSVPSVRPHVLPFCPAQITFKSQFSFLAIFQNAQRMLSFLSPIGCWRDQVLMPEPITVGKRDTEYPDWLRSKSHDSGVAGGAFAGRKGRMPGKTWFFGCWNPQPPAVLGTGRM